MVPLPIMEVEGQPGTGGRAVSGLDDKVDDEFAGEHGSVVTSKTLEHEAEPDNTAQTMPEISRKVAVEARQQGGGILAWVRSLWHHSDREFGGEYERREDESAPPPPAP